MTLADYASYSDAIENYSRDALWRLFDGSPEKLNIAHECIDRHAGDPDRVAVTIAHADGPDEKITFAQISAGSSRFAKWLEAEGVQKGERIAFMFEPSLPFYLSMFGAIKYGAISVPLFTLFGPEALALRLKDCQPTILITNNEKAEVANSIAEELGVKVVVADDAFLAGLDQYPAEFEPDTAGNDLAVFQYTSGTTRELPEAVKHSHKSVVTLMAAALYGSGIRPGDRFFCPSSPAWGHGLWHGTLAPLALGVATGTYAGRFDAARLIRALSDNKITNFAAAATHYRLIKNSGVAEDFDFAIEKLSYTGEPIDDDTLDFVDRVFGIPVCSMYGTTEIGVVLVNYPGAPDFTVKPGSLGKPIPGQELEVRNPEGQKCAPEEVGELMLKRKGEWISTKDRARVDSDGYFYHHGRADDVIISAGWTMSAVEIENVLLKHADVDEAAVIGVPDELRGLIAKAFIVGGREGSPGFDEELQELCRVQLSRHEYPRALEHVNELPKTPAGKINRKILRDAEARKRAEEVS